MIQFPDYTQSLINIVSSAAGYFGIPCAHPPLDCLEEMLQGGRYRNIVLLLFDGLGCSVLENHLDKSAFLRKHFVRSVSSVFPPTTTAAITSVETGLTPIEHGRLGWTVYFPQIDKNVNLFTNTLKDSREQAESYHVGNRFIPTETLEQKASLKEEPQFYTVSKFGTTKVQNSKQMFDEVFRLCNEPGRKYIYAYNEKPDSIMHISGTYSLPAKLSVRHINRSVQRFCRRLKQSPQGRDTLVLVTADHGHIPIRNIELTSFPALEAMLMRRPSIEPRAVNFFVKPEYLGEFPKAFAECFKTVFAADILSAKKDGRLTECSGQRFSKSASGLEVDFVLFSKEEVFKTKLFGKGIIHPSVHDSLGDYIAAACSDIALVDSAKSNHFKSHHAGLTADEMLVPLIAIR
ncbi:alkaline phosphatase family protein [Treponema sp. HNW]|uniref:alkaline phosphatase family protein n=1 Tax=Treponema sp. HNW TaxID=3116654 RepID=UPI003D0C329F